MIDDGGAVEVWCGVVVVWWWCGDGEAVGIMPSLKKTNGWKEIIKKD